jgi:hypothetical protein
MKMSFAGRFTFFALIGFALGVIIGVLVTATITTFVISDGTLYLCVPEFTAFVGGNLLTAFVIQAVVSGIYGAAVMGISAVYWIEEWSLLRATVTHFSVTMVSYYLTGFFLRWFSVENVGEWIVMFFICVAIYSIIWFSNYLSYKAQIDEINKELQIWKQATGGV